MSTRTVAVVTAGLSSPSSTRLLGDQLAAATVSALDEPVEVRVVELRDLAHQLTDAALGDVRSRVRVQPGTADVRPCHRDPWPGWEVVPDS